MCNGTTPLLQHCFAQPLGIAFPGFRKLDYLLRDYIIRNVAAINKPKRYECHLIGKTHEPHCLRVESWPFRWDRIGMSISRIQAGVLPNSQSPTPRQKPQSVMS